MTPLGLRCLLAPIILLHALGAGAQTPPLKAYSTADGLAHFAVNRILRDSRGFLWFCTREGLSMFDGYGFTTYRTGDGLPSANVTDIVETSAGIYWIGTFEGLVRFDPAAPLNSTGSARARFSVVSSPGDSRTAAIRHLVQDRAGTVWVGTNAGVFRLDESAEPDTLVPVDLGIVDALQETAIHSMIVDRRGALWVAAGPGVFVRSADGTVRRVTRSDGLPFHTVPAMLEDRAGRIWAAAGPALWRLALDAHGTPRVLREFTMEEGADFVTSLFETRDGVLWAGTFAGAVRVEPSGDGLAVRFRRVNDAQVRAIAEDLSGNLWLGTGTAGAIRLPRAGFSTFAEREDIINPTGLTSTSDGGLAFLGGRGNDWSIFCSDGTSVEAVKPAGAVGALSWAWNQALVQGRFGDWWLGTAAGVFRFTGAAACRDLHRRLPAAHFDSRSGLAADVVIRLFEDSRGDLWIATVGHGLRPDGLSRWNRQTGALQHFGAADGLSIFERHFVSSIAEDRAGNVWLGFSGDAGLARYRAGRFERFTREAGVPVAQIRNMVVDNAGRLWIASFRGLCRIDDPAEERPTFRAYDGRDGLAARETHALVPDAAGRIFVGSAQGIDRLDPERGFVRHYSHADGVPTTEMHSAVRDGRGGLWFSHISGILRYEPAADTVGVPPRVLITAVTIDGEPKPVSAVGERAVAQITVPSRRNSLHVRFVALGSQTASNYFYRYRLEPASSDWSPFADVRDVNFATLSPGRYRLLIEARDGDGRASESPATLAFTIVPPFWQRGWFVALLIGAAMAGGYGLHRHRIRRLLEITRIRDRIAADLHDDLGANLTKIAVLGEVGRQQSARTDSALTSIAGIARESVANMSDIVWAVDPARDTVEDLVRKMRQHASETFALGDVELIFAAPKHLDQRHVGIELRHDLFLLFKEAINNAARHSECRRVQVDLRIERARLRLRVADDGSGFDPGTTGDGHGMTSMRRRAARMGGSLAIDSASGRGTVLTLTVPLR